MAMILGGDNTMSDSFPSEAKVKVTALNFGPHTRTFGFTYTFILDSGRHYTLQIGRGNNAWERGIFVFNIPSDFGSLSCIEQAKVLIREYRRIAQENALSKPNDILSGLGVFSDLVGIPDENSLNEKDVYCR